MGAAQEQNFTAINDNWRQRVVKEQKAAKVCTSAHLHPRQQRATIARYCGRVCEPELRSRATSPFSARAFCSTGGKLLARGCICYTCDSVNNTALCISCAAAENAILALQEFDGRYDYLRWKQTPTDLRRQAVSSKVKYYRGAGGSWTVTDKRIPVKLAQSLASVTVCPAAALAI